MKIEYTTKDKIKDVINSNRNTNIWGKNIRILLDFIQSDEEVMCLKVKIPEEYKTLQYAINSFRASYNKLKIKNKVKIICVKPDMVYIIKSEDE